MKSIHDYFDLSIKNFWILSILSILSIWNFGLSKLDLII